MEPTLARVLNTVAHDVRTPLAVCQGYVRLLIDGRLKSAEDQGLALQRTKDALGALSALCVELERVAVAAEPPATTAGERIAAVDLLNALKTALAPMGPEWDGTPAGDLPLGRAGVPDLVRALTLIATAAFEDAPGTARVVQASAADAALTLRVGGEAAVAALPPEPDDPQTAVLTGARGGPGLSLIWALFILRGHRIRTWQHAESRGSVGVRIPMVTA